MARLRALKPEFAADEKMAAISRDARLTFLLVISQADDEGLLRAAPRQLLGALYPLDETVSAEQLVGWIAEAVRVGCLRLRETVDGSPVIEVVGWAKHQIFSHKTPSKIAPVLTPLRKETGNNPEPFRIEVKGEVEVKGELKKSGKDLCETKGESTAACGEVAHGAPANRPLLSVDNGDIDSNTARAVKDFVGHFYASPRRMADVEGQLLATLTASGTPFEGERVRAVDGRHLRDVMLETLAEQADPKKRLRDRDKAIIIVLLKLRKTYTETLSARNKEPRRPADPYGITPKPTKPEHVGAAVDAVMARTVRT